MKYLSLLLVALGGCNNASPPPVPAASAAATSSAPGSAAAPPTFKPDDSSTNNTGAAGADTDSFRPTSDGGVGRPTALLSKSESQVIALLGAATSRRTFKMSECCAEREIELYNTYSPDLPHRDKIEILELTWGKDGYSIVVWFHDTEEGKRSLHALSFVDGVEF